MKNLFVYGSLINPIESRAFGLDMEQMMPSKLLGFKRSFSQEPTWRKGDGEHRALLNVKESKAHWLNGILVRDIDDALIEILDKRERGYTRHLFDSSMLNPDIESQTQTYLYVGKAEKQNDTISPNNEYLEICLEGARFWGDDFYQNFLTTTFIGDRMLSNYLQAVKNL